MSKKCDGIDTGCYWKSSVVCRDCTRYKNLKENGRHYSSIKDRYITPKDHVTQIEIHKMMSKSFWMAKTPN